MKQQTKRKLIPGVLWLALFVLWTAAVSAVDVKPIGANDTTVGFAALNGWVRDLVGEHLILYTLTDLLSIIPLGIVAAFGCVGLIQWIKRKSIGRVDRDILLLGGVYLLTASAFVLFEGLAINYRPILIEGALEVSYPSSTTLLVLTVMPTARRQLKRRMKAGKVRRAAMIAVDVFTVFMIAARLLSGVHWFTDIIGGILLAGGLFCLYDGVCACNGTKFMVSLR